MATESGTYTPETVARKQKIAELLLGESMKPQKLTHWAEGLAQMARAGLGGYLGHQAEQEAKEGEKAQNEALQRMLGGTSPGLTTLEAPAQPPAGAMTPFVPADAPSRNAGGMDTNGAAIASIESGGKYDKLGPVITSGPMAGQRAIGKYQVMESNVGPWTKAHFGQELTPQQFLASPKAQEAVFTGEFGRLAQKHGPEGAARAWFAGEGGMNNPNRRDQLGTTVQAYGDKFTKALGGPVAAALGAPPQAAPPQAGNSVAGALAAPPQMAQATPAAMPPGAVPQAGGDMRGQIARMLADPNPYVQRQGRALATAAIGANLKQQPKFHKLNDEMLFEEGTGATKPAGPGFKPLTDPAERAKYGIPAEDKRPYQLGPGNKLINPPPETRLNIDQRAESAFETKAGQLQAERLDKIVQEGMSAKSMIADMTALKDIGSRVTTGKTAEIKAALGPYAEALGVKIDDLGDLQAYESIVQKLAPQMRVPGSGATSDFEMRGFLKALPGLGKTPEGNELIANVFNAVQEQKTAAAEIAGKVLHKEISRAEGDKMLRDLPDPMALWRAGRGKLPTAKEGAAAPASDDGWKDMGGGVRIREKK